MSRSLTPQRADSLGGYKRPPRLFNPTDHSIQLANTSKPLSLKLHSNLSFLGEILASLLSDPLYLQLQHFIDDLCVFVTLGDLSPRWTGCCSGVTKVVVDLKKFALPSPLWGFDIRN
jgi:hypothetical protein